MERSLTILFCLCFMLFIYVTEIGLVICDLRAGVRKAKEKGIYRTSEGYRRTIDKINRYFNMTFALSIIDFVLLALVYYLYHFYSVDIWMIPIFTILAGGYVAFVEIKSIWEPADIKEKKLLNDYQNIIVQLVKEYGSVDKVIESLTTLAIKEKAEAAPKENEEA